MRRINCRGQFRGPGCVSRTQRLAKCYTGAVHDVLRIVGHDNIVLSPEIKAIAPGTRLAGPAWTVSGHIERKRARDETPLAWCTMLFKAARGHEIVCPPHNHEIALMGELLAQTLQARRVLGYVVDGGSRDTELVLAQGFPESFAEPITIGTGTGPIKEGNYSEPIRVTMSQGASSEVTVQETRPEALPLSPTVSASNQVALAKVRMTIDGDVPSSVYDDIFRFHLVQPRW